MPNILSQYLADDHDRLDGLLRRALARPGDIEMQSYGEFRRGLLRHISIEEKIVLPEIAKLQGGRPASGAERIRLDHGAIASLLVPPPSASVIATLRSILGVHNALEEGEDGVYQLLDLLAAENAEAVLERMKSAPEVPLMPHNERPEVLEATRRAVARAGYEFKEVDE